MNDRSIATAFKLEVDPGDPSLPLDWLRSSYADPIGFSQALELRRRARGGPAAKSAHGVGFDVYGDAVTRHLGSHRTALRWYERISRAGSARWRSMTFEELHARCTILASSWRACGVDNGATLCVVLPMGALCAVTLLTALRLGARLSLLEPLGPRYLRRRLAALGPQHIASAPFYRRQLGEFADLILPTEETVRPGPLYSHTYRPGDSCLAAFSPLRDAPSTPVDVTADDVYAGAQRDGLITFALRPGDHLAAPGFHTLQHQPALLLAALVTGATFVHIDEDDVVREPSLMTAAPLRSAGVTAAVRDAVAARPSGSPTWQHWFRNPEEPTDWLAWRDFVDRCGLGDVPASNVVIDAAAGGSLLWSPRRKSKLQLRYLAEVVPAPGRPWTLLDFTNTGQPAIADVGVFAPAMAGDVDLVPVEPQHMILAARGAGYLYGGTRTPRRAGRVYPADEVIDAVASAPFLDGATVVAVPAGGATVAHRFVLVGFTGDAPTAGSDAERDELARLVAAELGPEFVPDQIVTFPLHARRLADRGGVDHAWCRAQFLSGLLFRKARTPVFRRLTAARDAVRAVADANGGS